MSKFPVPAPEGEPPEPPPPPPPKKPSLREYRYMLAGYALGWKERPMDDVVGFAEMLITQEQSNV